MKKSKTILKLIKQGEGLKLEFKSSLSDIDRIAEIVCSFANSGGGIILAGVSDAGKIHGVDIGRQTIERLTNIIVDNLDPKIYPEITPLKIDKRSIILIEASESSDKPHLAFGKAFIRVGKNTKPMSRSEYERLLIGKYKEKLQFDKQICKGASLKDIDKEKIKWFLEMSKSYRKYPLDVSTPVKRALMHLGLLQNEKVANGAILLFGKEPHKFHLQAETKCIHFHGTEIEKPFETYHIYKNNIFEQVDNALSFVLDRLKRPVIPEQGKPTTQRPYEIPEFVIREAIVNAIAHRDYYSNAAVQVMVFADRIEVWNPGELPPPLTLDSLRKPHASVPRNPLIAEVFYLATYIEKAGSGTLEMIKQCRNYSLPEPEFEQKMGCFVTTIWRDIYSKSYLVKFNLNERQEKAIQYVKERGSISNGEYCKLTGISRKTATNDLIDMVNKKIVETVGTGKRVLRYVLRLRKNYAKITQKPKRQKVI